MTNANIRLQAMEKKLQEQGYRMTPQRMAIVQILSASEGHPSTEEVYQKIRESFPTISLATVYKNINTLKEMGEVLELDFGDEKHRYDGNKPYPHPHFICTQCKMILDIEMEITNEIIAKIYQKIGFQVQDHRLDFYGLCSDCQKKV